MSELRDRIANAVVAMVLAAGRKTHSKWCYKYGGLYDGDFCGMCTCEKKNEAELAFNIREWLKHSQSAGAIHTMVPNQAIEAILQALEKKENGMFPRPCGLCPGTIESKDDLDWHGLGNCVEICERCEGSGIDPKDNKAELRTAFADLAFEMRGYGQQRIGHNDDTREEVCTLYAGKIEEILESPYRRPKIVCLCGSTRFYEYFQRKNYELTMEGNIVLSVGFYPHAQKEVHHSEDLGCTKEQKIKLDQLHLRKIDLADEILVLNVGGYIGHSTGMEIEYARIAQKTIRYLEEIKQST